MPDFLKDFTLTVEGEIYIGKVTGVTLPDIALKTEEVHGGGMNMPIDIEMGLEKLALTFKLNTLNPTVDKLMSKADAMLRFNGSLGDTKGGKETPIVIKTRGLLKKASTGEFAPAGKVEVTYEITCSYYERIDNGQQIYKINPELGEFFVGDVNKWGERKKNLGM